MSYKLEIYGDTQASPMSRLSGRQTNYKPTTSDLIRHFELNQWQAVKVPNHNEYTTQVMDSYHVRRENKNPDSPHHMTTLTRLVSEDFKLLQYDEGVRWLDPFLMEELLTVDSALMLGVGEKFSVCCNIEVSAEVTPGDIVNRYLLLALSHDSSLRGLFFCDTRPVCANTLQIAKMEGLRNPGKALKFDESHPERSLEKARQLIDLSRNRFHSETVLQYRAYTQQELEPQQADYIFRTILNLPLGDKGLRDVSDRMLDRYLDLQSAYHHSPGIELIQGDTGWRVLNAVTYFSQNLGKTEEKSFQGDLFGTGQRYRKQTVELLDQLLPKAAIPV